MHDFVIAMPAKFYWLLFEANLSILFRLLLPQNHYFAHFISKVVRVWRAIGRYI